MDVVTTETPMLPPKRRRASKACIGCRKKKTKCNYDRESSQCIRCREEEIQCVISEIENRGGYGNVLAGKEKKERELNQQMPSEPSSPSADDSVLKNEFFNTGDAIEILNCASQGTRPKMRNIGRFTNTSNASKTSDYTGCSASSMRRLPLHEADIVKDGILTSEDTSRLVGFFFAEIAPFYASYIPREYQELARIAAEPALLAVVCTLGARCLQEAEFSELHNRLWAYCKAKVSDMLWECHPQQTRSLVFAVLTIAEWFPGALLIPNTAAPGEALKRHTRICWPLMGQTVRLAKYAGLLKHDIQATITLHFTDHLLACRLGQQPMLHQIDDDSDSEFPESLVQRCEPVDRARLDIVKLLHMANRSLYRSRSATRELLTSGKYNLVLELMLQLVKKWRQDYREIVQSNTWASRTTVFEFNHFELYVFSIALIPWQESETSTKLMGIRNTSVFLQIAIDAASAIIRHESSSDCPVQLKFSPIQWITRLLHASVFLAKALLLGTIFVTPRQRQDTVGLLSTAAATLAQLPPEDHRIYSRPLEKICRKFSTPSPLSPAQIETASHFSDNAFEYLLDQDFLGPILNENSPPHSLFGFNV